MTAALVLLLGLGVGAGSALVPLLNAEAYAVVAAGPATPWVGLGLAAALAVGQTAGKLVLFEAGRRGSGHLLGRLRGRLTERRRRARRPGGASRVSAWLTGRISGAATVLSAAVTGLPPLAVVSVAAGAAGQRRTTFACWCLAGRVVRFAALVLPAAYVLG